MIRVLLADDQALVRGGFRMLLDSADDIEVVGEASDGAQAINLHGGDGWPGGNPAHCRGR